MNGYNLEELRREWLEGKGCKFLFFWGATPPAGGGVNKSCLSQWWMCPFEVDGVEYSCAEQYMMAGKARMFGDGEMLAAIMGAKHPKEMKAFGQKVKSFDKARWESRRYALVLEGNLAEFSQNPELWAFLSGTKNHILVEASPWDRIWGIGMREQNPDAQNPMKWRGANLLGFALTETRDLLERK